MNMVDDELFAIVIIFILALPLMKIVPSNTYYVVKSKSGKTRILPPGLHIVVPIFESITHTLSMLKVRLDMPTCMVKTKDEQDVNVTYEVESIILDVKKAAEVFDQLEQLFSDLVRTKMQEVISNVHSNLLLEDREAVGEKIVEQIDLETKSWGLKILSVDIIEVDTKT